MQRAIRSTQRATTLALFAGAASAMLSPSSPGAQVVTSWLAPTTGFWDVAANWSNGAPFNNGSTTYDVHINAMGTPYSLWFSSSAATIDRLHLDSPDATLQFLTGGSALTILNEMKVDQGTVELHGRISGPGSVLVNSRLDWQEGRIQSAGLVTISDTGRLDLTTGIPYGYARILTGTIDNYGLTSWSAGSLHIGTSESPIAYGRFNNRAGGLLSISADSVLGVGYLTPLNNLLNNEGAILKHAATTTNVYAALNNSGTVHVQEGVLNLLGGGSNSGSIVVDPGATLAISGDLSTGGGTIHSQGSLRIASGTHVFDSSNLTIGGGLEISSGNTTFNMPLMLDTLAPLTGSGLTSSVTFNQGVSSKSGALSVSGGLDVYINAAFDLPEDSLTLTSARLYLNNGENTYSTAVLNGQGSVLSSPADVHITDSLTWSRGTLEGSGLLILDQPAHASIASATINSRFDIAGTAEWQLDNNTSSLGANASINVLSTGELHLSTIASNYANRISAMPTSSFTNDGLVSSTGPHPIEISAYVTNTGTLRVEQGELRLAGGGVYAGAIQVNPGAILQLAGASNTFDPNLNAAIKGSLTITGGFAQAQTPLVVGQTLRFGLSANAQFDTSVQAQSVVFEGGSVTFNAPSYFGTLFLNAGVITFNHDFDADSVAFQGSELRLNIDKALSVPTVHGVVSGSGTLTITSPTADWRGTMRDTGRTVFSSATALTLSASRTLARVVDSYGTTSWNTGEFTFGRLGERGVWNNHIGATFTTSINGTVMSSGADNAFNNFGAFNRTGTTTSTTTFASGVAFNNTGVVNVQSGSLHLLGGGSHTGAFNVSSGASLRLAGNHNLADTASINSAQSALLIVGGSTTLAGQINALSLQNSAAFTIAPTGIVTLSGAYTQNIGSTAVNGVLNATQLTTGTGTLSGSGTINANVTNSRFVIVGAPHGGLAINGAYTQTAAASLLIDIFSPTNADRVTITGPAALAGTLGLTLDTAAFTPQWGQSWTIASYASRTGDFATFSATSVNALGLRWWRSAGPTDYILGLRHVADTNHDGAVDFLDLNNVLGTFGQSAPGSFGQLGLIGDANEDGNVDFLDLNIVLGAFGLRAPPAAIPAPSAAAFLALAAASTARRRRAIR